MATQGTSPRMDDTFTRSPFLIPFSLASLSPISTYSSGCISKSHICQRVNAPEHQCSVQEYVVQTYGNFSLALATLSKSLAKIWTAGLMSCPDIGFLANGPSSGS